MKTFFDGVFIEKEKLEEAGIKYPIKLEYFRTSKEENVKRKFGFEVVKTEYLDTKTNIEKRKVNNLTEDIEELDKILQILRKNEVTPVGVEDVLKEIFNQKIDEILLN